MLTLIFACFGQFCPPPPPPAQYPYGAYTALIQPQAPAADFQSNYMRGWLNAQQNDAARAQYRANLGEYNRQLYNQRAVERVNRTLSAQTGGVDTTDAINQIRANSGVK